MSDICTIKKSTLDGIAEAIQSKTGESGGMLPSEMVGKIEDLPSQPAKGLVFSEYDSDGYPHKAEFVGSWTEIPSNYLYNVFYSNVFGSRVHSIIIPNTVSIIQTGAVRECRCLTSVTLPSALTQIESYAFSNYGGTAISFPEGLTSIVSSAFISSALEEVEFPTTITRIQFSAFKTNLNMEKVIFKGFVPNIENQVFINNSNTELYDFSNHTGTIPTLHDVASLGHTNGCVIKVPSALLAEWQAETNWLALTDVTWVGV